METPAPDGRRSPVRRILPLAVLAAGLAAFLASGLGDRIGLDTLRAHGAMLQAYAEAHAALAAAGFLATYVAAVAFSLPVSVFLSLAGGFLFGVVWGTVLTVTGATLGAVCIFLAARSAFRETLMRRAGPWLRRLEGGFREHAASYLLTLRLIPVVPFWLTNLVPAFFGVPLRVFVLTTAVGVIPAAIVFVSLGSGLGETLAAGGRPDIGILLRPPILLPLLGLALLSLAPVAYKRLKAARTAQRAS